MSLFRFRAPLAKVPHFAREPEAFLHFLDRVLAKEKYDVVLPTHEQVYLLSRFRDEVAKRAGIALPAFEAMEQMQNKAHFVRTLEHLGIPHPKSILGKTRAELVTNQFPVYLKLAHSTAGAGVFRIESLSQLEQKFQELERQGLLFQGQEAMLQSPAPGVQSTVQVVFDQGEVKGWHIFEARQLGVGGMSSARVSAHHPLVVEHITKLGRHLNWHGSMFLDYFYEHATATPYYIECNPRIGETVNACLSGTNLCDLLVRLSAGESVTRLEPSRTGVRTQSFYMILLAHALEGATRRELWREIQDYRCGRGLYSDSEDELTRWKEDRWSLLPLLWISGQLLLAPGARARAIVRQTIANYSLPESATERIKALTWRADL